MIAYPDAILGKKPIGNRVAIMGSGGIGFDMAELVSRPQGSLPVGIGGFLAHWGIDAAHESPGGLGGMHRDAPPRSVTMLQRSDSRPGKSLGLTTGWVVRAELKSRAVEHISAATYGRIDDHGLHVTVNGDSRIVPADTVIVCIGQEPESALATALRTLGIPAELIGGADKAAGLDALRAIRQGYESGRSL